MNHIRCAIHGIPKPDLYVSPNGDHEKEFKMQLQLVRDRVLLDTYMDDNDVRGYGSPPIDSNWRP